MTSQEAERRRGDRVVHRESQVVATRLHGFALVVHRFFVSVRLCIASALQAEAGVAHGASVPARAGWQLCAALHIAINSMETKCCNQGAQAVLAREVADNLDAA